MSVLQLPVTADVLLLYPGDSLKDQIGLWALRRPGRQVDMSFERLLPEIRELLRHASAAMVDATEDPSQATDALLQAVARLGANAVAVYTETTHDGLELFVRMRGSLFLLGPLVDEQWDELFERLLDTKETLSASWGPVAHRPLPLPPLDRVEKRRTRFIRRCRASRDWPMTDIE